MKTNIKTAILGIALMASVTGAFASDIANAFSGKKLVNYEWQKLDRSGNVIGSTITTSTSNPYPEECSGDAQLCARGRVQGTTPYTLEYFFPAQ
ncbi:MAG: hypothetical protein EOO90_06540 [Pedobacter sp.]|nr:MAG: hypothetical protein EOO90_06540 [Pedobacter sp.]